MNRIQDPVDFFEKPINVGDYFICLFDDKVNNYRKCYKIESLLWDGANWNAKFESIDAEITFEYPAIEFINIKEIECLDSTPLDINGEPISIGDTVYYVHGDKYIPRIVTEIDFVGEDSYYPEKFYVVCYDDKKGFSCVYRASELKHKYSKRKKDAQEKINQDAIKLTRDYWGCANLRFPCSNCQILIDSKTPAQHYETTDCGKAKILDLLRRQRELDGIKD